MTEIAIISPGDRVAKITNPLDTTPVEYDVNPGSLWGYDALLCDTPDRTMLKTLAIGKAIRTPVMFRMRGDPFWGLEEWVDSRLKRWVAQELMLGSIDGCIAITPRHAATFRDRTGAPTTRAALSVDTDAWPETEHSDEELRIVTLTNAVYLPKIAPTIEAIEAVESVLTDVGGEWRIGSWSDGYSDRLRDATTECDHVNFCGSLDATESLDWANCMIHYSNMDVLPNAILEGMASECAVVTNDFVEFRHSAAPLVVTASHSELRSQLRRLVDPTERTQQSDRGEEYVRTNHSREAIGEEFLEALSNLGVQP